MIATGTSVGVGMSLLVAVWSADAKAAPPQAYRFGEHTLIVQPGPTAAPLTASAAVTPEVRPAAHQDHTFPPPPAAPETEPAPVATEPGENPADLARRYREVYNAIPFDRVEYEANPSYRHDAAMEMLFGKLRPTVIQRSHTTIDVHAPPMPPLAAPYSPYGFNSYFFPFFSPGVRVHRSF
jgi:hypothetical protein